MNISMITKNNFVNATQMLAIIKQTELPNVLTDTHKLKYMHAHVHDVATSY